MLFKRPLVFALHEVRVNEQLSLWASYIGASVSESEVKDLM